MSEPAANDPITLFLQLADFTTRLHDVFRPLLDASVQYRAECEAAGFSPSAAEQMALVFYQSQVDCLMVQMRASTP